VPHGGTSSSAQRQPPHPHRLVSQKFLPRGIAHGGRRLVPRFVFQ
jgi:hypothetical protein